MFVVMSKQNINKIPIADDERILCQQSFISHSTDAATIENDEIRKHHRTQNHHKSHFGWLWCLRPNIIAILLLNIIYLMYFNVDYYNNN